MTTQSRAPTSDVAVTGTWTGTAGSRFSPASDYPDSTGTSTLTCSAVGALTFGFTAFSLPAGSIVNQVSVDYYDEKTASQTDAAGARLTISGTQYNASTHNLANGTWTSRSDVWTTNPATSAAWALADLANITAFGWNVTDAAPSTLFSSIQITVSYTTVTTSTSTASETAYLANARTASQTANIFGLPRVAAAQMANLEVTHDWNFEDGTTQSWTAGGTQITAVANSTAQAHGGTHSLAATATSLTGTGDWVVLTSPPTDIQAGTPFIAYVYCPTSVAGLQAILFVKDSANTWVQAASWTNIPGATWTQLSFTIPSGTSTPLTWLGIKFISGTTTFSGTLYVDDVTNAGWPNTVGVVASQLANVGTGAATSTRTASQTAAFSAPGLTRSAAETAVLSAPNLARSASAQATISAPNEARAASQTAALSGGSTRAASQAADLSAPGLTRAASETAYLQATSSRSASEAAALLQTSARTASEAASLSAPGLTRVASEQASLSAPGLARTGSQAARISAPGLTRTGAESAAISAPGLTRTASAAVALSATSQRAASQSAALSATSTSAASQSATLAGTASLSASQAAQIAWGAVEASDTFVRANQSLWGTASDGQVWGADANSNAAFSISANQGLVSGTTLAMSATLGISGTDQEVLAVGSDSTFSAGNFGAVVRFADANNWYKGYVDAATAVIQKKVAGTTTTIASAAYSPVAGTSYTIRLRVAGTSLSLKVWPTGTDEPASWTVTATDTALTSGSTGLRAQPASGGSVTYTSFTAYDLAAKTVTASQAANLGSTAPTRTASQLATISSPSLVRTASEQADLSAPNLARSASESAALSSPNLTRTASEQASISALGLTRAASQAATLSGAGVSRTASQSADLAAPSLTRAASQTATLSGAGSTRTAAQLAAISRPGTTRAASELAAISALSLARPASQVAALQSTLARTAGESAALLATSTRSAAESARLSAAGLTRTVSQIASLDSLGLTRSASETVALLKTGTRTASERVAISASGLTRSASETAALSAPGLSRAARQGADITVVNVGSGAGLQLPLLTALVETGRRVVSPIQDGERVTSSGDGRKYTS